MIQYPKQDHEQLDVEGDYYSRHVDAMTREGLHSKSDIAAQLGARDREIDQLKREIDQLKAATGKQQVGEALRDIDRAMALADRTDKIDRAKCVGMAVVKHIDEVRAALAARQPVGREPTLKVVNGVVTGTVSDEQLYLVLLDAQYAVAHRNGFPEWAFMHADDLPAMRSRSEAWSEVYKTLREVCPDLMDHSSVGLQNALHAIRTLAANRTATQQAPLGYRWRHSASERWQYSDVPCGWQYEPVYAVLSAPAYTTEMGEAANRYHASFEGAHPLPAQWLWHELWERMYSARVDGVKS